MTQEEKLLRVISAAEKSIKTGEDEWTNTSAGQEIKASDENILDIWEDFDRQIKTPIPRKIKTVSSFLTTFTIIVFIFLIVFLIIYFNDTKQKISSGSKLPLSKVNVQNLLIKKPPRKNKPLPGMVNNVLTHNGIPSAHAKATPLRDTEGIRIRLKRTPGWELEASGQIPELPENLYPEATGTPPPLITPAPTPAAEMTGNEEIKPPATALDQTLLY